MIRPFNDNQIDRLVTKDFDLHGRRVRNAANSEKAQDYVTRSELQKATSESAFATFFNKLISQARNYVTRLISPPADSTSALVISKADRRTPVLVFDTTNGFVGLGTATPLNTTAGRRYLVIEGISNAAALELIHANADADATIASTIQTTDPNSTSGDKKLAAIQVLTDGGTGNDRGGRIRFLCKPDGSSGLGEVFNIGSGTIGFFGAAPVAQETLSAYTTNPENVAYTGLATGLVGTPYASINDLNLLRVAYENLRLAHDDLRTKLQTTTLIA